MHAAVQSTCSPTGTVAKLYLGLIAATVNISRCLDWFEEERRKQLGGPELLLGAWVPLAEWLAPVQQIGICMI